MNIRVANSVDLGQMYSPKDTRFESTVFSKGIAPGSAGQGLRNYILFLYAFRKIYQKNINFKK